MEDDSKNQALCKKYLTDELRQKLGRQTQATDADAIIRAQDVSQDMLESLKVKELSNDWYVVSFQFSKNTPENRAEIPLRARSADGKCVIYYIAPNGYGEDHIKADGNYGVAEKTFISQQSELAFIESFYKSYASIYCRMDENLNNQLKTLRSKYLTENAQKQYEETAREAAEDNSEGYDLLIDNYDFDPMWYETLHIKAIAPHKYQMTYSACNQTSAIDVTIKKTDNQYKIDSIGIDEGN